MLLTAEKTVGQIASEEPSSIRVFESLGLDYCCGGKRSLSDACSNAGLDIDRVQAALEEATRAPQDVDGTRWDHAPLSDLTAHIVGKHHAYVRSEGPRLVALFSKVVGKHGEAHPELVTIQELFAALSDELTMHMMKEERILFPYVEALEKAPSTGTAPRACFGSVRQPIAMMMDDHDQAGTLLSKISRLSGNYAAPEGVCLSFVGLYRGLKDFEADLHQHIHLENNILFPRAIQMEQSS
jgi:regulator of cell morphogenesis and NO signaling